VHAVDRIRALGANVLVAGSDGRDPHLTSLRLARLPTADRYAQGRGGTLSERRAIVSSGFGVGSPAARRCNSRPARSNTVTVPVRPARRNWKRVTVLQRLQDVVRTVRDWVTGKVPRLAGAFGNGARAGAERTLAGAARARGAAAALAVAGIGGYIVYSHPPMVNVGRGEAGVRVNRVTGSVSQWRDGAVFVLPGLHDMAVYSLRDRTYQPEGIRRADGPAPLQSVEGLSLGVDLSVRYALDPGQLTAISKRLPEDIGGEIVEPAVQGAVYKVFARYTVREIFSTKRVEIQQALESELAAKLAPDGVLLRGVQVGKVDLPADYKRRMDTLLAEELATQKMRYTLELKEKRVKEIALDGEAEKVRSEKAAEAAARAQVIAARAQEEAMKHVLPFKQRQIEQRRLEAEAEKAARIRGAEGSAQARRIEAGGEADARQKLADAEAYRLDRLGKVNAEQMAREGDLITRHPLLVQKALADKLSDKVQVIIAPPPADGGFIGTSLIGAPGTQPARR
jgi:regulator of protease activity HflC (stomatin/prohibitin superfamily)